MTVIRLLGVVRNPANGFPARPLVWPGTWERKALVNATTPSATKSTTGPRSTMRSISSGERLCACKNACTALGKIPASNSPRVRRNASPLPLWFRAAATSSDRDTPVTGVKGIPFARARLNVSSAANGPSTEIREYRGNIAETLEGTPADP